MTDDEIRAIAWDAIIKGAESYADDWLDEDGVFPNLDIGVMRLTMYNIVDWMLNQSPPEVEVPDAG